MRLRLSKFIKELLNGTDMFAVGNEREIQACTAIGVNVNFIRFGGIRFRRDDILAVLNVLRSIE
jgi:hypothetical protein